MDLLELVDNLLLRSVFPQPLPEEGPEHDKQDKGHEGDSHIPPSGRDRHGPELSRDILAA